MATLASWILAPKEFNLKWDVHKEWRRAPSKNLNKIEEFYGFDKWKEIAEAFIRFEKQFPKQFLLVCYSALNKAPLYITEKLFCSCELKVCGQVKDFLKESKTRHDLDQYSIYRAKACDDRWQSTLPKKIAEQIMLELKNTLIRKFSAGWNKRLKFSVILTSFNHEKYIRDAIDSVLTQTFTDFELIIWDDASIDDSWSIIKSYSDQRIKAFRNQEQKRVDMGVK